MVGVGPGLHGVSCLPGLLSRRCSQRLAACFLCHCHPAVTQLPIGKDSFQLPEPPGSLRWNSLTTFRTLALKQVCGISDIF